ncbi:DUF4355 domain-containing protein [Tissierella praeacuta]|uniref:DUF4355 domain-containing protein n=1 Tax=Tissierella praeacuta TaxID=43131 RepID=UPI002FDAF402
MLTPNSTLRGVSNLKGIPRMNLQLFANGENTDNTDTQNTDNKDNQEIKTYSQEELDKLLQSETDKRVTEALKTTRAKWEEEFKEKLEKEKKEAERLSKLSADEKEKELLKQQQEQLAEKERAIQLRELQLDTINVLAEEKLPVGFAEFLIKDNAETTNENIKKFKKEWQDALSKAVDEKIKGTSPRLPESKVESNQVTDFMKLANEASIRK